MQRFLLLMLVLVPVSCSRRQNPENVLTKKPESLIKSSAIGSSPTKKQITNNFSNLAKNDVEVPTVFMTVQPSIDALFINAFNREAKEKKWEAVITGVVLISPDWEEVNDPNTQEILGRTRTAAIFAKGEEGLCIAFERYTIFQTYKNGSFIGKPRGYSHTESKDIDCKKYEHLFFKRNVARGLEERFDERNE